MSSRRLLAWAVILAMVAGAWILSNGLDQRHEDEETKANRLLELDNITAALVLEFKGRDYPQPLRLERGGQEQPWRLTQPLAWPADGLAVGRVLESLARTRVSQRLEQPGPWSDFGLEPPRLELTLTDPQGGSRTLLVGEISPSRDSVYLARPGQGEVLLAPAELGSALTKSLLELRDKIVLDFPLAQVRRLELGQGPRALVLERAEAAGHWTLAGHGPADPGEVENLLLQIHGLLAQGFVDQDFKPAKLGLEPPRGRLILTLEDGSQKGLLWGVGVSGKNQTYARRKEGGPLMLVRDESLERLARQPQDLLDRRLFTLEAAAVERLRIQRPGQEMIFARQDGQWRRLQPPGDAGAGQAGERLVWDLLDLKWEKPLPAGSPGLETPRMTLTLSQGGGQEASQVLELGPVDPQSGLLLARLAGQSTIFGIKSDFMDRIPQVPGANPREPGDEGQSPRK
jgi:hypothetical protein